MSLFYKCDCCGQIMHKLGADGEKRRHLDIGDLGDPVFNSTSKVPEWNVVDTPLVRLDLCQVCYNSIILNILDTREKNGFARDLTEVSIDGESI